MYNSPTGILHDTTSATTTTTTTTTTSTTKSTTTPPLEGGGGHYHWVWGGYFRNVLSKVRFNFFRALSHCYKKTCLGWQRQLETEPEPGEMLNPLLGGAERLCLESPLSSGFLLGLKSILHLYWRSTLHFATECSFRKMFAGSRIETDYLKVVRLRLNVGLPFKSWFSVAL